MTIPTNLALFSFVGYGPEPSTAVAALTRDHRLVVADSAANRGTSVTNAIESALSAATKVYDLPITADAYQWTPNEPAAPMSLWRVIFQDAGPEWQQVEWREDPELRGAVEALTVAAGIRELPLEARQWLTDDPPMD